MNTEKEMDSLNLIRAAAAKVDPVEAELIHLQDTIALRIAELLKEKGWTQQTLADKMGKQKSFVSRILSGTENLTLKTLISLQQALGSNLYVLTGAYQTPAAKLRAKSDSEVLYKSMIARSKRVVFKSTLIPMWHSGFEHEANPVEHGSNRPVVQLFGSQRN